MKPKEFDELVRQKFDRNDFEYNPANWDMLSSELDGRTRKNSMMMWWWLPIAGIAASVALAIGISLLLHSGADAPFYASNKGKQNNTANHSVPARADMGGQLQSIAGIPGNTQDASSPRSVIHTKRNVNNERKQTGRKNSNTKYVFEIKLQNALGSEPKARPRVFDFMHDGNNEVATKERKEHEINEPARTFKPEAEQTIGATKTSVILMGGINHGSMNSGYMAGGTVRRMISDRLYVESDVAFTSSNNTQSTTVLVENSTMARHESGAGRAANTQGGKVQDNGNDNVHNQQFMTEAENESYTLNYAQITPGLGYKVTKKISVGLGPDFQQALADNRPATSNVDRGPVQEAPMFDVGFMGKSEYSITKNIKAGVSYRKGVNNFITPTADDKFIDRDYLMIQLKCAIFNK